LHNTQPLNRGEAIIGLWTSIIKQPKTWLSDNKNLRTHDYFVKQLEFLQNRKLQNKPGNFKNWWIKTHTRRKFEITSLQKTLICRRLSLRFVKYYEWEVRCQNPFEWVVKQNLIVLISYPRLRRRGSTRRVRGSIALESGQIRRWISWIIIKSD